MRDTPIMSDDEDEPIMDFTLTAVTVPPPTLPGDADEAGEEPLRKRMNNELNFSPNFEGLVLGCIDADFCK